MFQAVICLLGILPELSNDINQSITASFVVTP